MMPSWHVEEEELLRAIYLSCWKLVCETTTYHVPGPQPTTGTTMILHVANYLPIFERSLIMCPVSDMMELILSLEIGTNFDKSFE